MESDPPETEQKQDTDFISEDSDSDARAPDFTDVSAPVFPNPETDSELDSDSDLRLGSRYRSKEATLEALDAIVYATFVSVSESNLRREIKDSIMIDVYNTVIQLPPLHQRSETEINQLSELRLVAMAEEVLVNLRFLYEFSCLPGG